MYYNNEITITTKRHFYIEEKISQLFYFKDGFTK